MRALQIKSGSGCEIGALALDIKAVISGVEGQIEGYASLFGEIDKGRDIVLKGAFVDSLKARGTRKVPMLFQHDPDQPIGVWTELKEDEKGLHAKGQLLLETQRGREIHSMLKADVIDGLSIGFRTVKSRFDTLKKARMLERVDLWEISVVTFPLLESARALSVKADFDPRELEAKLRDAGLSRADAVTAIGVLRKSVQWDAGTQTGENQRDAGDLMNSLSRFNDRLKASRG